MKNIGISENELRLAVNEEVLNLQQTIKDRDKLLESYKNNHGTLETLFRDLKTHIEPLKAITPIYKPKNNNIKSECSAIFVISDVHLGEIQEASEIENFGIYNPDIARSRCLSYITRGIDWIDLQRHVYKLDECVVLVLGDLIAGSIHEELQVTNEWPAPQQAIEAGVLLSEQISLLAQNFKIVRTEFVVTDNHSRLSRKPQNKLGGFNSYNYIVGHFAKERLKNFKNVIFNIYPQYEAVISVQNRRYLCSHGHNIKTQGGIPFASLDRQVGKEAVRRINGDIEYTFHKIVIGHFHMSIDTPTFSVCGSTSGCSSYDHSCGRFCQPQQSSWLVHKDHGDFGRINWDL